MSPRRAVASVALLALAAVPLPGCGTEGAIVAGVAGTTAVGAHSPNNEIGQVYYVGIFDPQEQVPQAVYRIRVHGQASFISGTRFASGWVPSALADSLGTHIGLDEAGRVQVEGEAPGATRVPTGRGLVLFGPEGFRPAPRDHRLAIVMGSSPEKFFDAINSGLETIAEVRAEQNASAATNLILTELLSLRDEREALREVRGSLAARDATSEPQAQPADPE